MGQGREHPAGDAYVYVVREEAAYLEAGDDEKPEVVPEPPDPSFFKCSFCRRTGRPMFHAQFPVRHPKTFEFIAFAQICHECVTGFAAALARQREQAPPQP